MTHMLLKGMAWCPHQVIDVTFSVFRSGTRTDIYVNLDQTYLSGDEFDDMPTPMVMDLIAQAAIAKALATDQLNCAPLGTLQLPTVRVIFPACVVRSGKGSDTHFTPCGATGECVREYTVACPVGSAAPIILPVPGGCHGAGNCGAGGEACEPTCPGN